MSVHLKGNERQRLKQAAHSMKPVVIVGKEGVSEALVQATHDALAAHELIKVRFFEHKQDRSPLTDRIAARVDAVVVDLIGHVAVLYRPHQDPEKRRFKFDE